MTAKEKACARSKKHYAENREAKCAYQSAYEKRYREEHRDEARAYAVAYRKRRFKEGAIIGGWLAIKFKDDPCLDCGVVYPYYVMDFDHRQGEIKSFGISAMNQYAATPDRISKVMKEIDKCDIVCSNCHRKRTQERHK